MKEQFIEIFCPNRKNLLVLTLLFFLLVLFELSHAATASTTVAINLTAIDACTIPSGVNSLAFNNYDPTAPTALTVTGSLSIQCSAGSTVSSIGLDNGLHASGNQRQMLGAVSGALLRYNIYQPNSVTFGSTPNSGNCTTLTTVWDNASNLLIPAIGTFPTLATNNVNICGQIPVQQNVSADTYSDTVTIYVSFT